MSFAQIAARVKAAVDKLYARLRAARLWACLRPVADRLLEKVPPEKRRLVLPVSIGFCAVFALVLVGVSLSTAAGKGAPAKSGDIGRGSAAVAPPRQGYIPPDDLFLPDEPDFVPGILLEREQRAAWTADDAAPLWQDPLRNGEEPWRDRIERTIDEIMESVP